ncbi:MAG: CDP-diacylglycerol--glycerol-3-phosphate 3-phosphatidyltransferase [Clostridia bacterium]|jgi:CDP-diacylglycerol--glycerol-3-phosphate 3-phosphatidyltransferase
MNLPNKITILRILFVPVFMFFVVPIPDWMLTNNLLMFIHPQLVSIDYFIAHYGNYIAAILFIIASSTDGVDGYIARKRDLVTSFGKFLDPIADKLLTTAALIALVQSGDLSGWAAMIIIGRDLIVTGLRLVAAGEGIVIAASMVGKIKTIFQMVAISMILLKNWPLSLVTNFPFDFYAMLAAVIITLYSGFDYVRKNIKLIKPDL